MVNKVNSQLKTKKRVSDYGEVFTHEREVNGMLDLVKNETERLDSRFLEPACGTGNFLVEVLNRKLLALKLKYMKSQPEYEKYGVIVISSLYGVDLLEDNVLECRQRLLRVFEKLCRNFSITKRECWEILFLLKEVGFVEIVPFHGIKLNK
jgi:type II restriction/modification system DNA methylase subunit YeeA